ncbi:hypothetical protein Tco_1102458 [Tanacetum coccineum]
MSGVRGLRLGDPEALIANHLWRLDTFYNALNANDQDSLNSARGGTLLDKMLVECLRFIETAANYNQGNHRLIDRLQSIRPSDFSYRSKQSYVAKSGEQSESFTTKNGGFQFKLLVLPTPRFIKVKSSTSRLFTPPTYQGSVLSCVPAPQIQVYQRKISKLNKGLMCCDEEHAKTQGQKLQINDPTPHGHCFPNLSTSRRLYSETPPYIHRYLTRRKVLKGYYYSKWRCLQRDPRFYYSSPKVVDRETEVIKDTKPPANKGIAP